MRAFALVALMVVGCGSVTAKTETDGGSGGQAATGGAGGELGTGGDGELGGRGGAAGTRATGGAGVDAGPVTSGPCAGLCSNPITIYEALHQHMTVTNSPPGSCYAITSTPAGASPTFSCAGVSVAYGDSSVEINGHPVAHLCAGALGVSNIDQPGTTPGEDCVKFSVDAPTSAVVGFY